MKWFSAAGNSEENFVLKRRLWAGKKSVTLKIGKIGSVHCSIGKARNNLG